MKLLAVLVLASLVVGTVNAQEGAKGGASKLMKPLRTTEDVNAVQTGDYVVSTCPMCKSSYITRVERPPKGTETTTTTVRQDCPGCSTKFDTKGAGKAKTEQLVHVCKKCGSDQVMCCVVKKGDLPTGTTP